MVTRRENDVKYQEKGTIKQESHGWLLFLFFSSKPLVSFLDLCYN